MMICEDCGTIITQKNFWVHKHSNYGFVEPEKILSKDEYAEYIYEMSPEGVEKFVKDKLQNQGLIE